MTDLDLGRLYRYSGLVDSLRDSAHALTAHPDIAAPRGMADTYNQLRTCVADVLSPHVGDDTLTWTVELPPDASICEIFVAATQLSRWADVVHQTPKFLLAEQATKVGMDQVAAKLVKDPTVLEVSQPRDGLYL